MSDARLFIDTTATTDDTRIVRGSVLADFWDAGLADSIMTRRSGFTFEVQTIGALLNSLIAELEITDPGLAANLDRYSLERFIRDMTANGYNIAFTDELVVGKRLAPPTVGVGDVVPGAGNVSITAQFQSGDDVDRLYCKFTRQSDNQVFERVPNITLNGSFQAIATVAIPTGTYTGFVAGVDSNLLRGFKSTNIAAFSVA